MSRNEIEKFYREFEKNEEMRNEVLKLRKSIRTINCQKKKQ